jgi:dTDP-4-dehydrorhamnose 3,5-epimerase
LIFHPTDLQDAHLIELKYIRDDRGFFARSFCANEFAAHGLHGVFVQQNNSQSLKKGTIRGLHYQTAPHAEVKVMRCLRGAIYNVIVDLRPNSRTYRRWQGFELSAENRRQLYVPEGFANGYQALTDEAEVAYLVSVPYAPGAEGGVRYDDPEFPITWPIEVTVVSDKDRAWPNFVG